jgi:hypothetical protein
MSGKVIAPVPTVLTMAEPEIEPNRPEPITATRPGPPACDRRFAAGQTPQPAGAPSVRPPFASRRGSAKWRKASPSTAATVEAASTPILA